MGRPVRVLLAMLLVGCVSDGTLVVQVRTDLAPGRDFASARVLLSDGNEATQRAADDRGWGDGVRVAELILPPGEYRAVVALLDDAGTPVVERPLRVDLESGVRVVTVLLTRECAGVACDDPNAPACLGGRCVSERCYEEGGDACGMEDCTDPTTCEYPTVALCAAAECTSSGSCFLAPDHGECPAGEVCDVALGCRRTDDLCGNGVLDAGEVCDPNLDNGKSCRDTRPFTGDGLRCASDCSHRDYSGCSLAGACNSDTFCDPGERASTCADCRPGLVSAGESHTCVSFRSAGANQWISCWGLNTYGELGDGTTVDRSWPMPAYLLAFDAITLYVNEIATGFGFTCASGGGEDHCWGRNDEGQLGITRTSPSEPPLPVLLAGGSQSCGGRGYACFAPDGGRVQCTGLNDRGQLGDSTTTSRSSLELITGANSAVKLSCGTAHTCLVERGGGAHCWGANDAGQLGDGSTADGDVPVTPMGLLTGTGVTDIAAGERHTCAIIAGGVLCWGSNARGQLGDGTVMDSLTPTPIMPGIVSAPVQITAGLAHTCVLQADGAVVCWGANDRGQLGRSDTDDSPFPMVVAGVSGPTAGLARGAISAGGKHTCVVDYMTASCWGANEYGQLGDGTQVDRSAPVFAIGLH